jgi:fructose-specific PTS system IIB-like component
MTNWILISKLTETSEGVFMTSIIAVTACPSGVAHLHGSGVAGERRQSQRLAGQGGDQGSIGIENELSADDVASADIVILTKDIGIKCEERFAGKTIVRVNISDAVKRADAIMNKIDSHLSQKA